MQNAYSKLYSVVNIAVCNHFSMISIINHIEICANCYVDTISS